MHDAIAHDNFAGKLNQLSLVVQPILRSIAKALQFLHEKGMVHADLKPLNIICVGVHWMLIDLDAAVKFGEPVGMKYTKAVLPPEMLTRFGNQKPMQEWSAKEVGLWADGVRWSEDLMSNFKAACSEASDHLLDTNLLGDCLSKLDEASLDDIYACAEPSEIAAILAAMEPEERSSDQMVSCCTSCHLMQISIRWIE